MTNIPSNEEVLGMYLTINSLEDLVNFIVELKRIGLLKEIKSDDILNSFGTKRFPIQIPMNVKGILNLFGNPIVKGVFGKQIDSKVREIYKAAETG